jgi:hypothetical protein
MNSSPEDFKRLKQKVREKTSLNLMINKELEDWSMNDIHAFQDDLEKQCKSSVSEKWVYTHFKNEHPKLPRVDVLNLLSEYCGYKSWTHFLNENLVELKQQQPFKKVLLPLLLLFILFALVFLNGFWKAEQTFLIFKDAYTRKSVPFEQLNIIGFKQNEPAHTLKSPLFNVSRYDSICVNGAYYKKKCFPTSIHSDTMSVVLYPDDYVLMLNFFSRSETDNWQKRKTQLRQVIHTDAEIFQVHPKYQGLEILNKQEFIDRLTLPTHSLKDLEILDIQYQNDQIFRLRFVQKELAHD